MNTLSWLLYAADVIPSIGGLATCVGIIGIAICAGWSVVGLAWGSCNADRLTERVDPETYARARSFMDRRGWIAPPALLIGALATLLLSSLIPSRETVLLIAGSEAGEAVVTSDAGRETLALVQDALKAQLRDLATSGE